MSLIEYSAILTIIYRFLRRLSAKIITFARLTYLTSTITNQNKEIMKRLFLSCLVFAASMTAGMAQQAEKLGRGAVAVKTDGGVYLSWRSLAEDPAGTAFDVYRDGVKVNMEPISQTTNYVDAGGQATSKYIIKAVNAAGQVTGESTETAVWGDGYLKVHLDRPADGTTPDGVSYTYSPNDCSVGDVDGDGEYEIILKWDPSNSHDNSEQGYTGNVYLDAYELDGTKLWRIDLGRNIRAGAHYTQFMVYDLDGDGRAEVACKTAPGTIDGQGKAVLMGDDRANADYRGTSGKTTGVVLDGPEYLTVFDGLTGAERATVAYDPPRSVRTTGQWGDSYGNRSERYLACIAYLDGRKPSLVMCRGYYTAAYIAAWDFDGKTLKERWLHKSETSGEGLYAEGAHALTVGDVDGDGCDEIVYGSACLDHDGTVLYRTGAGHGDALHLGDFDPDREGLEIWMVHEEKKSPYEWDAEFRDAKTGEIIWGVPQSGNDIGRGVAADVSDTWRGAEVWAIADYTSGSKGTKTYTCRGEVANGEKRPSCNFRIYWDGDLLEELLDGTEIVKRNAALTSNARTWELSAYSDASSCNTSKKSPCLSADILGDWREEVVLYDSRTCADLLVFTTTEETQYKVPCLMQDHIYRMAVAWQNVAYNQPPHLGYYLPDRYSTDAQLRAVSGQLTQTVELGESIGDIVYSWKNATGVEAEGLPDGVEMTVDAEETTLTISGTPKATGTYTFTVTTTGGLTTAKISGTITVRDKIVLTPVAAYPFDVLTGTTTPNTVSGQAEGIGAPALTEGIKGNAAALNGSTYFTQAAYPQLQLGTQDFTVEFWMKSTDDAAYIFHKGSIAADAAAGTSGKWIGLEYKGGLLKFAIDDNATKSEASADGTPYMNGEWTHIVCVRDSYTKTLKLYANGALIAESTDATGDVSDNSEPLTVGNVNVTLNNYFDGAIDEFTIYTGAMSAAKVKERYEAGTPTGIGAAQTAPQTARLTLVSATSGMVVAKGIGSPENITKGAAPGVYILIIDKGTTSETKKIVIN